MHIDIVIHDATLTLCAGIWCSPCPSIPFGSKNMVDMHDVVACTRRKHAVKVSSIEMAHDYLSYLI